MYILLPYIQSLPFPLITKCTLLASSLRSFFLAMLSIVVELISYLRYFAAPIFPILILFTIPLELPIATKYITILV